MSRYGTCVGHDGQGKKSTVKDDKRLLSFEPGATKQFKEVRIYAPDEYRLAFDIEFPNHRSGGGGEYWQNLQTFVDNSRKALPPVDGLGLDSNPTTAPFSRQPRTPVNSPPTWMTKRSDTVNLDQSSESSTHVMDKSMPPRSSNHRFGHEMIARRGSLSKKIG
jgi:hypothetical protein